MKFEIGQLWVSPRGYYYRVISTNDAQATLRMGMNASGRKHFRKIDVPANWSLQKEDE